MRPHIKLMVWAATISFLGTLPLGTLNVNVANFMFRHDLAGAISFSIAAVLVEMMVVRIALVAIRRLQGLKKYFRLLSLITCILLLAIACNTLLAAYQRQRFQASLPFISLPPFFTGFLLSILNPLHLPFWMGWTAILKSKKILDDHPTSHNRFVIAIGIGTATAFSLYGIAGRYLIAGLGSRQVLLNWIVGIGLLVTAVVQLYRTFFRRRTEVSITSTLNT